jgi:hypothetical protein
MSLLISELPADDTLEQFVGAVGVVEAVRNAVGIAEIELGKVAVKVLFAQC